MSKFLSRRLLISAGAVALPVTLWMWNAQAAPSKSGVKRSWATRNSSLPGSAQKKVEAPSASSLPKYVSLATVERIRKQRNQATVQGIAGQPMPVLQPVWEGHALKTPMRDLLTSPVVDTPPVLPPRKAVSSDRKLLAQGFPRPLPPAAVPSRRRPATRRVAAVTPKWVRYPLEFQLCGIGLGTRAVDKDRFNRIDRYGLFALHGNPTAIVVPSATGGISVQQQPPEVAALFPSVQGNGLPDWASAITVSLDNNHVQWLYRRETYSMGFVVDRLGFVDAIVVAGVQSNIARTQLEDPLHTVKLGDDLRKVMFRYGYPDTIETYGVNVLGGISIAPAPAADPGNAPAGGPGAQSNQGAAQLRPRVENRANFQIAPGAGAAGGEAAAAEGGPAGNAVYRTFELRYEQSYNVVFTIRNNRVVRMYIFGDPDFFNERRRNLLRSQY